MEQGNAWYVFARSHYQYDNVSRIAATWRDEQSSKGEKYWYTANNQLSVVEYNADQVWTGNPANWDRWVGYTYTPDLLNRQNANDNGTVTNYTPDPLNQYINIGSIGVGYDGNFNLNSWGGAIVNYDAQNRITYLNNGNSASFTYDGLGRCVRRTINGAARLFTYDGWKPMLEWDGSGNFLAWNIYGAGPDEIMARWDSSGQASIYKQDQHGNVVAVLDPSGDVTEKYTYDAFGQPTIFDKNGNWRSVSAIGNRFMFQGREYLSELGIYDFRNRMYHPALGGFMQPDPLRFGGGDANLFRYCGGDPVNESDPFGLEGGAPSKPDPQKRVDGNTGNGGVMTANGVEVIDTALPDYDPTAGDGHRDIGALDRVGAAAGEGSSRDTGSGGGEGTLYAQLARPMPLPPPVRPPPQSNQNVPVAPLPPKEVPQHPHDHPENPWPPSPAEARKGLDVYFYGLKDLFDRLFGSGSTLTPWGPSDSPHPTPGPSSSPSEIPGASPSGPPAPHG